jgi:DNA polymerase-3 subunit gamma/tau
MLQRVSEQARLLGAASVVRAMTVLGESLVEMRHAPDPRLLLEVSMVKLTTPELGDDVNSLRARLDRVEQAVARGRDVSAPLSRPAPTDPNTGRAQLGGKVRSAKPAEQKSDSDTGTDEVGDKVLSPQESKPDLSADTKPVTRTATGAIRAEPAVREKWMTDILPGLRGSARAIVSGGEVVVVTDTEMMVEFPNAGHCTRATKCLDDVQQLVDAVLGAGLAVKFVAAESKGGKKPEEIHDIDPAELTDAPKVAGKSAEDHLSDFFPGITKIEDPKK